MILAAASSRRAAGSFAAVLGASGVGLATVRAVSVDAWVTAAPVAVRGFDHVQAGLPHGGLPTPGATWPALGPPLSSTSTL